MFIACRKETRQFISSVNQVIGSYPVEKYLYKVSDGNTRAMCKICSKLTVKTPDQRH